LILWSDVFLYDSPNGEKLAIYLMDTQGLFDHKTTSGGNSRIFSLSTLISSMQILNLHNVIQEDQIQYLQFATEYARYASADEEKTPFQNLMILVRDWNSPDEYKYGVRGGNLYLNSFLEIRDYQTQELQSVRRYIRSSFDKIDCFLMAHPGKTVARNSSYNGQWREIDEDFVSGMQDLFRFLFLPKKLTPKKINGVPIKPADLLIFINTYVESFSSDNIPEATNIYESTLNQQFQILTSRCVDLYIKSVASHDAELKNEDDINKVHVAAKSKAVMFFDSEKKFGSYSEGMEFKRDLEKKIEESFTQWKAVTLSELKKLQVLKEKTNEQVVAVEQAQAHDKEAKLKLQEAVKKSEEAKKALEQARFDTEEAKKQAAELAEKSRKADLERAEAIAKEQKTREWLEKMTKDKKFHENEYKKYQQQASASVGNTLGQSGSESGFASKFNDLRR
jgi:Guanylate-binding protein, N-terminal domain